MELLNSVRLSMGTGEVSFPGLAEKLAASFDSYHSLAKRQAYGTQRWMDQNLHSQRDVTAEILIGAKSAVIERLSPQTERAFDGLNFKASCSYEVDALRSALSLLDSGNSILGSLGELVRSIHLLEAGPEYDISHSDPSIPYSIFLSVPPVDTAHMEVRVLESIIHEAMHLQLSLIERIWPLKERDFVGYSPWQRKVRPAQGLLHGLYVFRSSTKRLGALRKRNLAQALSSIVGY